METDMKTDIATMTASELVQHIKQLDERHKRRLTTFRALARARKAEEEASKQE